MITYGNTGNCLILIERPVAHFFTNIKSKDHVTIEVFYEDYELHWLDDDTLEIVITRDTGEQTKKYIWC